MRVPIGALGATPLVLALADAITRQESVNPAYNNPGALMDVAYYQQTGQFRLMQYPTLQAGYDALYAQIQRYIDRGYDLQTFFATYAPAGHGGNDPAVYASNVSSWTGIPLGVPLNQVQYSGGGYVPDGSAPIVASTGLGLDFSDPTTMIAAVALGLGALLLLTRG